MPLIALGFPFHLLGKSLRRRSHLHRNVAIVIMAIALFTVAAYVALTGSQESSPDCSTIATLVVDKSCNDTLILTPGGTSGQVKNVTTVTSSGLNVRYPQTLFIDATVKRQCYTNVTQSVCVSFSSSVQQTSSTSGTYVYTTFAGLNLTLQPNEKYPLPFIYTPVTDGTFTFYYVIDGANTNSTTITAVSG